MGNYLKFDIYDVDLASVSSISGLRNLLVSTTNRSLVWIQDFDCSAGILPNLENEDMQSASMNLRDQSEVEERPQKSLNEKQQEYQDLLIRCVAQHLGLSKGKPVAACIIYKCLRQWGSFEVERTSIFDRIIQTIGHAIETQDNNENLAYWLPNASTLLLLLQRTLKSVRGSPQGVNLSFANGRVIWSSGYFTPS